MKGGEPQLLRVEVLGEEGVGAALPEAGTIVIGSSEERAGLVVHGQGVDDAHCAIGVVKGGGWAIKDLGSRYGTLLNGQKIASARLFEGDVIVIGSRRLLVLDPAAAPKEEPRPEPEPAAPAKPPDLVANGSNANGGSFKIPKRIGGYRIDRLLGRGGMGTVFLAEQESLHRPVALKILSPRLAADADFVRKFQTEARAAAALNHPNVVVVHDVGEADGHHYLSMEFMEQGSLEDKLTVGGKIAWRTVLDILHDAARGLMFAEERGIVHRDIKPANLMQNAAGTIKIADLGLATTVEAEATQSEGKKIYGTPHFISPEQARGEAVDNRSDLYSLGASAYRLLTGHTPFEGESTRDILRGHFNDEPRPLRELEPEIPAGLDELVLRLLAKAPEGRFPSAEMLLKAVDRLRLEADHGITPALALGAPKRRTGLWIGLGIAATGIAGLAFSGVLGGGGSGPLEGEGDGNGVDVAATGAMGDGASGVRQDDEAVFSPADENPTDQGHLVEAELERLNLEAENEYLRLQTASLSRGERIQRYETLITTYPGTDAAAKRQTEIEDLRRATAEEAAEAQRIAAALKQAVEDLRKRASLPRPGGVSQSLPRPGDALRIVKSYDPGPELASPDAKAAFETSRREVAEEIVRSATDAFRRELEAADQAAASGDFDRVQAILDDLLPRFDLPTYEPGEEPAGLSKLALQGVRVRGSRERLPSDRLTWQEDREIADRTTIASSLPHRDSSQGFEGEMRALDLDAASERLAALLGILTTENARTLVSGLERDVRAARGALDALIDAYADDGWRRKAVPDPRSTRGTTKDALGATANGIVLEGGDLVPWSAFGAHTEWLHQLFDKRLNRSYTPEELRGIVALLRLSAAIECVEVASQMLRPESAANWSKSEAAAITAVFEHALAWVEKGIDPEEVVRLEREREAAEVLSRALVDVDAGSWASAEAGIEFLLTEYRDTLVVALLSDGRDWTVPEPSAKPEEPEGNGPDPEEGR
ncbi:MAG: serine/threonine-protein kinase [Planctomycetota bacterium]|nr:serine/threonine-protein kinase [Planctomycetota bacterium]